MDVAQAVRWTRLGCACACGHAELDEHLHCEYEPLLLHCKDGQTDIHMSVCIHSLAAAINAWGHQQLGAMRLVEVD